MHIDCIKVTRQSFITIRLGFCILKHGTKICEVLNQPTLYNREDGNEIMSFGCIFFKVKFGRLSNDLSRGVHIAGGFRIGLNKTPENVCLYIGRLRVLPHPKNSYSYHRTFTIQGGRNSSLLSSEIVSVTVHKTVPVRLSS